MTIKIAVPSAQPGGLEAGMGMHFGHCDLYTLVDINDETGEIEAVDTCPSCAHEHGGCLAPVNYLAEKGVKVLLAGGMGMRPLMGFMQVGIDVYYAGTAATVGDAVAALLRGELPPFTQNNTCGAHH